MKTLKSSVLLLMIILMLTVSASYLFVSAADAESEISSSAAGNTYSDSFTASGSGAGGISFFSDTVYSGCYGNQLSGLPKELYDLLVEHYVTKAKTGEYVFNLGTAFTFNAVVADGMIEMNAELAHIMATLDSVVQMAFDAFVYDHPEIFWLRSFQSTYSLVASGSNGRVKDITLTPVEIYSGASAKASEYEAAVDAAVSQIAEVVDYRYETLKNIHDYICNNAYYNLIDDYSVHSSEAFFIGDGGVVCEGYAKAFKVLCDRFDIPCALVSGDAGGAHMWNYVQLDDGNWYLVDVTWDDQESQIYYTYFVANSNTVGFDDVTISEERTEHRDFSGSYYINFVYPVLSDTEYYIHTHEWEADFTIDVEPTCTKKGSKSIHCKHCDETIYESSIDATGHPDKAEYPQQEPTCSENGYTAGVYCPDCDKWLEGHAAIPALTHIMGGWSENSGGKHIKHCTRENCDYTESEFCTYGNWITTKEPTCKEKGSKSKFCSTCNHAITMTVDSLSHTAAEPVEENRTEPGCETAGRYDKVTYCSVCDTELIRTGVSIAAIGHDWDSGTVTTAPVCNKNGVKIYTCLNDSSHKRTVELPAVSDNHEGGTYLGGNFSATCLEQGYTGDTYCNGCGMILSYGEFVPALGHIWSDWEYAYSGCHERECLRDGCWYDELIMCSYGDWIEVTAPTCTMTGQLERICSDCGNKDYAATDSTEHIPGTPVKEDVIEATCTKDGSYNERINCVDCGALVKYTRNVKIPAFGHDWDEGTVEHVATCNNKGFITYRCRNDSSHTSFSCFPDFDYTNHAGTIYDAGTEHPGCTEPGYIGNKKCSACGMVVEPGVEIPATGHYPETDLTPATLTENGKIETYCAACVDVLETEVIYKIGSVTLSETEFIYDGKNKNPSLTVKDSEGNELKKNVDYKVSVSSKRSGIGRYTVKVTFMGNYEGSAKVYFTIRPGAPAKVKSAAQSTSAVKVTWSAVPGAAGYNIYYYSASKKAYVKINSTENTTYTVKGLLTGKKYTFKVVAYGKTSAGKMYESLEYTLLKTATKTKTPALNVTSPSKGKITLSWTNVSGETGYQLYYSTSKDGTYKKYANCKVNSSGGNINKASSGKTYYFKVRTYTKTDSGYVYSAWSEAKGVKVK